MNELRIGFIASLILVTALAGCSGIREQEVFFSTDGPRSIVEHAYSGFEKIEIDGLFGVDLRFGDVYSVVVDSTSELVPYIDVKMDKDTLKVGLLPGYRYSFTNTTHTAAIVMPKISAVSVTGKSAVTIHGLNSSESLRISADDFSSIKGAVEVDYLLVNASSFSSVWLSGSARKTDVNTASNATVNLDDFTIIDR